MAKQYDQIIPTLQNFIKAQPLFFVATAPLSEHGHVNLSPKGYDTFCILSSNQVAYLDLTGSGNETSAHLAENGRITFMFCAFGGAPQILRLYGKGETVLPGAERWDELLAHFPSYPVYDKLSLPLLIWYRPRAVMECLLWNSRRIGRRWRAGQPRKGKRGS